MISTTFKLFTFALASACLCSAAHATTQFNFDNDNLGTSTNFTDSVNGLSATFSSSADPGGFTVMPSVFDTLTGNVLGDPGPAGENGLALDISFSQTLSALSLDFATADFGSASLFTLVAFDNGNQVGTASATGTVPDGFYFPEGEISFAGTAFNSIELSTAAPDFAIDNINANSVAPTPEPSSLLLLGTGLLALGFLAKRASSSRLILGVAPLAFAALFSSGLPASAQVTQSILPLLPPSVSTVPGKGDLNPYGVAFAPSNTPKTALLQPGNILVSNFNNSNNLQGTGTTIIRVDKAGNKSTFFTSAQNQGGLSAALGVLTDGIVLVGNLPTADGTPATAQPGRLAVLSSSGQFLGTFGNPTTINGPWGMAIHDTGNGVSGTAQVFVSNVLNGVVSRINMTYNATSISASDMVLAEGFNHRADPAALELGPAGMAYSPSNDTLYVASSSDNAIYEIPTATSATSPVAARLLISDSTHMHGPLDISILPDGNLLVANSDGSNVDPNQPSELVEYTPEGTFLAEQSIDPTNGGAFGLATYNLGWGTFRLAAVDDNTNTLNIWTTVAP
jgi:hypothetical protein